VLAVSFRDEIVALELLDPTRSTTSEKFGSEEVPLEAAAILEPGVPVVAEAAPVKESHRSF
jgi:hypothetical protein